LVSALLSLEGVCKSYWRGSREIVVLENVSLDVHPGELVAVWGQRGAGKSTLAGVAAGLEAPDSGTVMFDGRPLKPVTRGQGTLDPRIGWVQRLGSKADDFQSVADYVSVPLLGEHSPRKARRLAVAMLERLGVADSSSLGLESLTDGERTLVAIARALVRERKLLIADDPTANLDVPQREEVTALLRRAADEQGLAILMMVPDMPEMAYAHRVGALSDARLTMSKASSMPTGNVIDFRGRQRSA
jgi:ABC-type lipoprotein export system ATPase subunit